MRKRAWGVLVVGLLAVAGFLWLTSGRPHPHVLADTPIVAQADRGHAFFGDVPAGRQGAQMTVVYAADRMGYNNKPRVLDYTATRSGYLSFGVARVSLTPRLPWSELVRNCTQPQREQPLKLVLQSVEECGMLAVPLSRMEVRDGRYRLTESAQQELADSQVRLREILRAQLADTSVKDVYLYIHGFRNTFDQAVLEVAELWHFLGRRGVAMVYTWPAGHGGLAGYAYDRESGEFTIYHLKKFLLALASSPDVKRVHIIAHSRGADVMCTALRELHIAFKAQGLNTADELKLENLVLAAPDLDADVFEQRFGIEDLHRVARRTTIYLSADDWALKAANWLFGGQDRLGTLSVDDLRPAARRNLTRLPNFNLVNCRVSGHSSSHNYTFKHPAALSDLILLLRDGCAPGATNGRPLFAPMEGVWQIDDDYLGAAPPGPEYPSE